jgi:hypothetical protein
VLRSVRIIYIDERDWFSTNFRNIKCCCRPNEFCITHYNQVSKYTSPYFPRTPILIKIPGNGVIGCNKFVNMPVYEADVNTSCNSVFYINKIISYHLCLINSKFSVSVQMSPHFLSFFSRDVHLYLVQCVVCKRCAL